MADEASRRISFHHFGQLRGMARATLSRYIARYDPWLHRVAATVASVFALWKQPLVLLAVYHLFIFDLPFSATCATNYSWIRFLARHLCPWRPSALHFPHYLFCEIDSLWISTIWYVSFLQFLRWALGKIAETLVLFDSVYMFDNIYTYIF
jgi:hypothetical protein